MTVVVCVVVAAGAAIGAFLATSGQSLSGISPAAFVTAATHTTLDQQTVDIDVGGSVSTQGHTLPITGSGQGDLAKGQMALTDDISYAGRSIEQREIVSGSQFYMAISGGGQDISTYVPGKHWVQVPVPVGAGSSLGTGTADPLAQLSLLEARGNSVKQLGTKTIHGVETTGYAVTPSRQNVDDAEQRFIATSGLSPDLQQQLSQQASTFPTPTIDVWFDAAKLLRRMSFHLSSDQGTAPATVVVDLDFVRYGVPVAISPPAPDDVASFSEFLAATQSSNASGTGQ